MKQLPEGFTVWSVTGTARRTASPLGRTNFTFHIVAETARVAGDTALAQLQALRDYMDPRIDSVTRVTGSHTRVVLAHDTLGQVTP